MIDQLNNITIVPMLCVGTCALLVQLTLERRYSVPTLERGNYETETTDVKKPTLGRLFWGYLVGHRGFEPLTLATP